MAIVMTMTFDDYDGLTMVMTTAIVMAQIDETGINNGDFNGNDYDDDKNNDNGNDNSDDPGWRHGRALPPLLHTPQPGGEANMCSKVSLFPSLPLLTTTVNILTLFSLESLNLGIILLSIKPIFVIVVIIFSIVNIYPQSSLWI